MAETKFGKRIRSIRQNAECSQKEFCTVLDIPQSTLSAYETDRMQPTVATLINIATKYNVSMDWLCGIDISSSQLPKSPQTFYEKLIYLIEDKGITKNKLLTDLKLNRNSFGNWQKQGSKPRAETMERIAEYFEVTPESLTKDNTEIQYLPTAKKLIAQPAPPTVKLNGTNFTAEIPAYVFTELMSVLLEKLEK